MSLRTTPKADWSLLSKYAQSANDRHGRAKPTLSAKGNRNYGAFEKWRWIMD